MGKVGSREMKPERERGQNIDLDAKRSTVSEYNQAVRVFSPFTFVNRVRV